MIIFLLKKIPHEFLEHRIQSYQFHRNFLWTAYKFWSKNTGNPTSWKRYYDSCFSIQNPT